VADSPPVSANGLQGHVVIQLSERFAGIPALSLAQLARDAAHVELARALEEAGNPPSRRAIQSIGLDRLLELEAKAAQTDFPPLFSLATFWRVDLSKEPRLALTLIRQLQNMSGVIAAYMDSEASGPAVNPTDDPLFPLQGHLTAAPVGIDAVFAWRQAGGDGTGIGLVDLEQAWNFAHEDLAALNVPPLPFGDQKPNLDDQNHGTSALAIMVGRDNTVGGIGVAPGAGPVNAVSHYDAATGTPGHVADAITHAATFMAPGDVLVLEVQTGRGFITGWPDNHPIEIKDLEFGAIRLAVAQGIVVIEAAGNAGRDLDGYVAPQGTWANRQPLNKNNTADFRDSGAILVGATHSSPPHARMYFSNYGSRLNCFAWGENVVTAGKGDLSGLSRNSWYTAVFDGTSAATAIIGGAALVVQGVAQAATGQRRSPAQIQAMFAERATGTPSAGGTADMIGVMPDLRRVLMQAMLVPDVYLRDAVGDDGAAPALGAIGASPDVIVLGQPEANPMAAYGEGSGLENRDDLGSLAIAGTDNFVYLRVRNRGLPSAANVVGTVYWSEPSTLVMPGQWTLIGSTAPFAVPQGDALTVSPPVQWNAAAVPVAGHYCLVAMLDSPTDPAPAIPAPTDWAGFLAFIRDYNNVAWRNVNVVPTAKSLRAEVMRPLEFTIAGAPDSRRAFDFEIVQKLPPGVRAFLDVPAGVEALARIGDGHSKPAGDGLRRHALPRIPIHRPASIVLGAEARHRAALILELDPEVRLHHHTICIRQLYDGAEVGRILWRFVERASTHADG
jgi:hypothetical protein